MMMSFKLFKSWLFFLYPLLFTRHAYAWRWTESDAYGSAGGGSGDLFGLFALGVVGFLIYLFFKERELRKYIIVIFTTIGLVIIFGKYVSESGTNSETFMWLVLIGSAIWGGYFVLREMYESDTEKQKGSVETKPKHNSRNYVSHTPPAQSQRSNNSAFLKTKSTRFAHRPLPSGASPKVRELFRKALDGDPEAQFQLARSYEIGNGVEDHYIEAARWYKESAEHGHPNAAFRYALLLKDGLGVDKDLTIARKYAELARQSSHQFTDTELKQLADLFDEHRPVVSMNSDDEINEMSKTNDANSPQAPSVLLSGTFGEFNPEELFQRGVDHETGRHGPANYYEAAKYYLAASEKGHKKAQFNLSLLYRKGLGVEKNEAQADRWLNSSNT